MCGFVGFYSKLGKANEYEQMNAMLSAIHHRGPDDTGVFQDEWVQFGFKRLSIIDLENGAQPLNDHSKRYWIIFNGEIYNYVELREKLVEQGYPFQTESDTEVIIALYSLYKEESVKLLEGMFSFLIWDTEEKSIFGARDPFGIKPLFYFQNENELIFASEVKSIFQGMQIEDSIDETQLQHYLTFQYVPEPNTLFPSIKKVKPGHYFTLDEKNGLQFKEYWHPTFHPVAQSEKGLENHIQEVLRESVKKHMRSDVPVGCFLSGGIDSTIVATLCKEFNPNIKTFSVGFEIDGYSEIDVAKKTAEALGVENISYNIKPEEFIKELPKIVWHLDDPVADPAAIPLYFLARTAREHVTVALSGEGADELFGGYNIYREPQSLKMFDYIPETVKKSLMKLSMSMPDGMKGKSFILRGCTPIEERFIGNAKIYTEEEKAEFFKGHSQYVNYRQVTESIYDYAKDYDDVTKMQYVDMHTWLKGDILVKADKMSMAHSLEVRVPFLDKVVFDAASSISKQLKVNSTQTKTLLRKSVTGLIPEHVTNRRKLGFPVPLRVWLKDELYDWAKMLIQNSAAAEQYFHQSYLLKLLEDHRASVRDNSRKLWTVFVFLIWHSLYVEQYQQNMEKYEWLSMKREIVESGA